MLGEQTSRVLWKIILSRDISDMGNNVNFQIYAIG